MKNPAPLFADNLPPCLPFDLSHPSIANAVIDAIGRTDLEGAIDALQEAEELGGPEGDDYAALMQYIADFASANAHCARTDEEAAALARVYSDATARLVTFEATREAP